MQSDSWAARGRGDRLPDPPYVVDAETGCWLWLGTRLLYGHGRMWRDGRKIPAHQHFYELAKGPVPEGLELDHLCRNPPCVNPDHLEAVSHAENCRRGANTKLTFELVREIRAAEGTQAAIGLRYGVTGSTVGEIRRNEIWAEEGQERVIPKRKQETRRLTVATVPPGGVVTDDTEAVVVAGRTFVSEEALRDESHNRASAARKAKQYAEELGKAREAIHSALGYISADIDGCDGEDQAYRICKELREALSGAALGLPDEEGEPCEQCDEDVICPDHGSGYGAAPPPRGTVVQGADVDALRKKLDQMWQDATAKPLTDERHGYKLAIFEVKAWLVGDVSGEGEHGG